MCGIAGYFALQPRRLAPREVLERMVDLVRHRGPDAGGVYLDERAALGHRRLSIIDLASGQQPLSDASGSLWVTFNGEIFNYVELREELIARGRVFRTRSDTETIVQAYAEYGPSSVESFNGDFAYGLYDRAAQRLILARDRMGVRPLYYAIHDGVLIFASEAKSILAYPGMQARLDPFALDQCFTFWSPLAPRTAFQGIYEVPPGHQLVAQNGSVSIKPYWQLQFPHRKDRSERREEEVAEEVESLLVDATRIRMRADVQVGAYLSGGFDSSATTAMAKKENETGLRTFSLEFESPELDEAPFQRTVVSALNTQHSALRATGDQIAAAFPAVIGHTERPVLRSAPAALYLLSRMVQAEGIKVVMTGEGADEVFGGYDIFKEAKVRRFWARQPTSRWRPLLLRKLYPWLGGLQAQSDAYLQAFFRNGLDSLHDPLFSHLPRFALTRKITQFYSAEMQERVKGYDPLEELRCSLPAEFKDWHPLSQAQFLESGCLLPGYILSSQGDRVAMAHAVEGRFPFLDHRVVELAASLPPGMKVKGLREKHVLRRALGPRIPAEIVERPKQPYRAPDSESFLRCGYVDALLSPAAVARAGYFEPTAVGRLLAKCRRRPAQVSAGDNMAFMGILSTQLLHSTFVANLS